MTAVFVASLGALLPVTNPVFVVAAYAGLTESFSKREVRRQAILVGAYSFLILGAFALLGTLILHAFGISLYALQIAGGLVVAYAGFGMLSQREGLTAAEREDALDRAGKQADIAISPMALPIVAGDRGDPSGSSWSPTASWTCPDERTGHHRVVRSADCQHRLDLG
jgi:multiple antibiotic resistance protein